MRHRHVISAVCLLLIILGGCESEGVRNLDDLAFYPLKKGNFWIYDIEEHAYFTEAEDVDSFYELKEEVVDSFMTVTSVISYVIERSTRASTEDPWIALDTWTVRLDNDRIIVTEGNQSYIKLFLPLYVGKIWDGNALNSEGSDEYRVSDMPEHVASFDDAVEILQEDEENLLFREKRREIYARNTGLVYREKIELTYCADAGCIGQNIIEEGTEYYQTLTEYGD